MSTYVYFLRRKDGTVICRSCEEAQEGAEGPVVLDQHVEANTSQPINQVSNHFHNLE